MAYVLWRVLMKKYSKVRLGIRNLPVIPAERRPPEKEETWTLAADQQDPCVFFDDTVDTKAKTAQDFEKFQSKSPAEVISMDASDNVDNILPRSQEIRKSKTKKVKNYLKKCKGALSKGDESVTEKRRQENCTSWYLEDVPTCASQQEDRDEPPERYTEFPEERLDETIRDVVELVEDPTPEMFQESFSRGENLDETPDEALIRLLEEDRRVDLNRSRTSLYEDARGASPQRRVSEEKTPTREPERFCDEEKQDAAVSLETLTTEDTNLNKCDSSDTLIAEVPETTETTTDLDPELTIALEEERNTAKEPTDGVDDETMLPVPAFHGNRGDFASLVRNLLGPIYGDSVMNLLIRQARDILVCAYHGNLENFVRTYLSPAATLLAEVKNIAYETNKKNSQYLANSNDENSQNTLQCKQNNSSLQEIFTLQTIPNIYDLLEKSKTGRIILSTFKNKEMNSTMRNKLCNIIVTYMEDHNITMTNEIAKSFSENIIKIFPLEAQGTYFIDARRKSDTIKKSIAAKGKLMSCWRNRKYAIRKLQKQTEEVHNFSENDDGDNINEDIKKDVDWLKINQAPWEVVVEKWHLTCQYRLQMLTKSHDNILNNLFEEWPLLKHPYGYKLVKHDFDEMQLTPFCLTFEKWNEFFNIIKENVEFSHKNDDCADLLNTLSLDISEDSKVAVTIQLLSYMIPPKQKVKQKGPLGKKKHSTKASIILSKNSMIKYAANSSDITKICQEVRSKAKELQISVQPYIIVVGSYDNVSHSFVTIDEVLYTADSTLEALDICFKAFHVFKVNYPDASKHLWMLMQRGLYKFCTEWDELYSNTEIHLKKLAKT